MINLSRNNVHVSGKVLAEERFLQGFYHVTIGINSSNSLLTVIVQIDAPQWEQFKQEFPDKCNSVTISGRLRTLRIGDNIQYIIQAGKNSISCFHNFFDDESGSQFYGLVKLRKKFDFDTKSKMYLKRLVFEICDSTTRNVYFEAIALRGTAPYFDNIEEGEIMFLKASFVIDENGNPPYWRIKHQPELIRVSATA